MAEELVQGAGVIRSRCAIGSAVLRWCSARPSIARDASANRTKRRAACRLYSAIAAAARPCVIRPVADSSTVSSRIYADCGNLKDARATNFQPLSCFCQACRTPILVLVTLPSSSLSDTHR
jgi:hypothetical protein